ncbi:MAG: hypothetical protein OEZ22_04145 [Spirochaetia bacterium]|nr:hypothetical protein [Spirochaetia bacterium]
MKNKLVFFAAISFLIFFYCAIDKGDHHFLNPDDPTTFIVDINIPASISKCDLENGENGISGTITALDKNEEPNKYYKRKPKLAAVTSSGSVYSVSVSESLEFVDGVASFSSPVINGLSGGTHAVKFKASDDENNVIEGYSDEINMNVSEFSHFRVTMPSNHIYTDPDSFNITVTAIDQNGNTYTDYNAQFQLAIDSGTITPTTGRILNGGSVQMTADVSGYTSNFTISAIEDLTSNQPADVLCDGGGGLDGGTGGGEDSGGEKSIPSELACTLTSSTSTVYRGEDFNLNLTITKKDQNGIIYNSFDNTVSFSSNPVLSLSPTSKAVSGSSSYAGSPVTINNIGPFTISPNTGLNNVITADINDSGLTASCSVTVDVLGGLALYGDNAADLKNLFEAEPQFAGKTFIVVTNLSTIVNNPLAFDGVIVNKASSLFSGGSNLTATESSYLETIYLSNIPVILAADNDGVVQSVHTSIWGISSSVSIPPDNPAQCTFSSFNSLSITAPATPTISYWEAQSDSYVYDPGTSSYVVQADVIIPHPSPGTYALILQTLSGTNAVIMGDAIYHSFHGNYSPNGGDETQWWELSDSLNPDPELVINIMNWTFGWP